MNDPIISPWLIWFIGISPNIANMAFCCFMIGLVGCIPVVLLNMDFKNENLPIRKNMIAYLFMWLGGTIFLAIFANLTPDREWLIATFLANETTPENISLVTDAAGDAYGSVKQEFIEIIQEIQND